MSSRHGLSDIPSLTGALQLGAVGQGQVQLQGLHVLPLVVVKVRPKKTIPIDRSVRKQFESGSKILQTRIQILPRTKNLQTEELYFFVKNLTNHMVPETFYFYENFMKNPHLKIFLH